MGVPWWVWPLAGLWSVPPLCIAIAFLRMKPIHCLPEEGEEVPPPPGPLRQAGGLVLGIVVLLVIWPLFVWREYRR